MENQSYNEMYNNYKRTGLKPVVFFGKKFVTKEEYLPVLDFHIYGVDPNRYMISNFGNIIDRYKGNIFVNQQSNHGYMSASIHTKFGSRSVRVHRLELLVFDYNPNYKNLQVNHIDGNPSNNILHNLEWTTPKENSDHAMLFKLHTMDGTENPNNKLTEEQVHEICKLIETGKYYDTEIADMFNVSYTNISDIHKRKIWPEISRQYNLTKRKPRKLKN